MASNVLCGHSCLTGQLSSRTRAQRPQVVPVRASTRSPVTVPAQHSWQQTAAAAAAAAALLLAPAAFAEGTPRKPTLGEERASYAEQLQNAVKERGQQLQELTDYPLTQEQKSATDQPFQNSLGAGNSAKDARQLFKLDDASEAPKKAEEGVQQLQDALPDFFKSSPQPEASQTSASAGSAASAVQQTAEKLPSPPANVPNPAEVAKKAAAKVPSPAAVPNPASSAKQAAKKADAGAKSPDPKEAAATRNGQLLIGGVATLGFSLWYSIERKADPSLGGGSPPPSPSPSPPAPSSTGAAPNKDEDPFFKNVKERTK